MTEARNLCPPGLSRKQCGTLVSEAARTRKTPSYAVGGPRDCLKAMSRQQCEATLAEQKTASESGRSFDVQACMSNPTPSCEAALRPAFEAQAKALREGG